MLRYFLGLMTAGLILTGCSGTGSDEVKTEGGTIVKFIKRSETTLPVQNEEFVLINMTYIENDGDTMFSTINEPSPIVMQYIDTAWSSNGLIYEAIGLMKKGDSATFKLPIKEVYEKTFRIPVPDTIDIDSDITFYVGVQDVMSRDDYIVYQQEQYRLYQQRTAASLEAKLAEDGAAIDSYLEEHGIEAETTASGLRYVITRRGSGPTPTNGQTVKVHYLGTLMDDTKFDSSYDRGDPLSFALGKGNVIRGWDEGIAYLNKGAKATLYIPSPLAYGERGAGANIPPFSILKFEVELVDFE